MTTKEPYVDRAFADVVWAAHILSDFSGCHDKLIHDKPSMNSISKSDSEDDSEDDDDNDDGNEDEEGSAEGGIRSHINEVLVPYNTTLHEKALDCIAELLSRKKGWHYVTTTALREKEDSVEVDVARNAGFDDDDDREYLLLLEKFIAAHYDAGRHIKSEHGVACSTFLRNTIDYYSARVDGVLQDAKNLWKMTLPVSSPPLDACGSTIHTYNQRCILDFRFDEIDNTYQRLHQFTKTLLSQSKRQTDHRLEMVLLAYTCVRSKTSSNELSEIILKSLGKSKVAKALKTLKLLSRPVTNLQILARIARERSSFQSLRFCVVTPPATTQIQREYIVTLRDARNQLGLPHSQRLEHLTNPLDLACSQKFSSHAEVQLVQRYEENPHLTPTIDYLGCSKKVCLLCESFLELSPWRPRLRGRHGYCYPRWGISLTPVKHQIPRLEKLCGLLKRRILRSMESEIPIACPVAQSSFISGLETLDIKGMDERATLRQEAEREAQDLRERLAILNDPRSRGPRQIFYTDMRTLCVMCQWPSARYCKVCHSCGYCSKRCQSIDWPTHKLLCSRYAELLPSRPSPKHRLGIWFQRDNDRPKLVWVPNRKKPEWALEQYHMFDSFLGADHGVHYTLPFSFNQRRGLSLDHKLTFYYHDHDSILNKSIPALAALSGSSVPHGWTGHIVAMSGLHSFADVTLADFRHFLDYFSTYWDDTIRQNPMSNGIRGVQVNCRAEQLLHGVETFIPVTVSPLFPKDALESGLSRALGIAVSLQRIRDEDRRRTEEITVENSASYVSDGPNVIGEDMSKENQNPYYRALLLCADESSEKWGTPDTGWQKDISFGESFLLLRDDRHDLDLADAECLCRYCEEILRPLFENSMAEGGSVSRKDVLKAIKPEEMMRFGSKFVFLREGVAPVV